MTNIKTTKLVSNLLIDKFKLLTHPSTSNLLFSSVEKLFMNEPTQLPSCELNVKSVSNNVSDNYTNNKIIGFSAVVYDLIETVNNNQTQANNRIDRIYNINDAIVNYLSTIPLPFEYDIQSLHIWKCEDINSTIDILQNNKGLMLYLIINFNIFTTNEIR